jgi:hypothetical protein
MALLRAATRNALPAKDFAGPGRSFPIEDAGHARNALARVANKGPAVKAEVRAKVAKKYPGIKQNRGRRGAPVYPREAAEYVK